MHSILGQYWLHFTVFRVAYDWKFVSFGMKTSKTLDIKRYKRSGWLRRTNNGMKRGYRSQCGANSQPDSLPMLSKDIEKQRGKVKNEEKPNENCVNPPILCKGNTSGCKSPGTLGFTRFGRSLSSMPTSRPLETAAGWVIEKGEHLDGSSDTRKIWFHYAGSFRGLAYCSHIIAEDWG